MWPANSHQRILIYGAEERALQACFASPLQCYLQHTMSFCEFLSGFVWILIIKVFFKAEKILKGNLDSIPSPSHSVKIQIMGKKVHLRSKVKTLLGNVLPYHLK